MFILMLSEEADTTFTLHKRQEWIIIQQVPIPQGNSTHTALVLLQSAITDEFDYLHYCSAGFTFTYDACSPVPCSDKCSGEGGCAVSDPFFTVCMYTAHSTTVCVLHTLTAYPLWCPCLSAQVCQDGGGPNVFGIGSVNSAKIGDVSASDWTFTMSYTNTAQGKTAHVSYTLATSGGTQFTFVSEDPANTYVSWCLSWAYIHNPWEAHL